jgi:4'-phosphopantetheinyl transferase
MPETEQVWSCTPADPSLLSQGVQVWAAWLDVAPESALRFWSTLSAQERERAARFIAKRERTRFVAARGRLRLILGSALGVKPQSVEFVYSAKGKPSLGGAFARCGLEFNLAHSAGLAVFALAQRHVLGVDVEQVRPVPELVNLVRRYFSSSECAEVNRLRGEQQVRAFFRIWTRKEAWLKATGEGLAGLAPGLEVLDSSDARKTSDGLQAALPTPRLHLHNLAPTQGFFGALAVAS